jgi:cysteine-rich repeat protein
MVSGTLEGVAFGEVDAAGNPPCTWDGSFQAMIYNPLPAGCGNGIPEQGESCDDGNTFPGDGCSASCMMEPPTPPFPVCGNGVLEAGESCDDGNPFPGDGCSACRIEPPPPPPPVNHCGNGVLEAGEQCDDGNLNDVDGCTSGCLRVFTTRPIAGQSR